MYCISCGSKLPENARYCAQCGAKVPNLVEDNEMVEEADDVIDVEAIVKDEERATASESGDALDEESVESEDEQDEQDDEAESESKEAAADVAGEPEKAVRQPSGALDLPEIDPSAPYSSKQSDEEEPYDPFAEHEGPFKPSYGPLKSADIDFSLEGDTAKMPRIFSENGEVLVEGDAPARNFVQSNTVPKRWTAGKVFLLVVMIIVALGLVFVIFWIQSGRTLDVPSAQPAGAQDQASQPSSASQDDSQPAQESPQDSSTQREETEEERLAALYTQLESSYDEIGRLNDDVAKAVDDYNTYYVDPDLDDRTAASERCTSVSQSISEAKSALDKALEEGQCTSGTAYYDQAQSLLDLFDLLSARVSPLEESWSRSVASSNPSADESYILQPIAEASSSNALSQFNSLYASSAPVEEG